ncbi:RNA-directed DNA polymerase, eukaryota [Tanacetum coccineum]
MGTDEWQEVSRRKRYNNTKEDDLIKISISIYVTNFPESFLAKDLFHACSKYGHVVDSFIPWKKSKEGKRFGFVRFINVFSVDRLVGNLCTIWIGRNKLEANIARFERAKGTNRNSNVSSKDVRPAAAAKPNGSGNMETGMGHQVPNIAQTSSHSSSALVLDDSCVIECDLTCYATGKVKAIESIQNLRNILYNEGFPKEASCDFVSDERVVWIDLEGVPLNLWSKETFSRIGRKWGLIQDIEAKQGVSFACKRLCLLTKHPVSILEQFKIIYKGKVSWVRAKELFTWVPIFSDINIDESDKDSTQDNLDQFEMQNPHHAEGDVDSDVERDVEGVAETIFSEQSASFNASSKINTGVQKSADPFGLYELLNKQKKVRDDDGASSQSQSHPPGFTPVDCQVSKEDNVNNVTEDVDDGVGSAEEGECPPSMNAKVMSNSYEIPETSCNATNSFHNGPKLNGGSILDVLDDMVRVGHAMGYELEGCTKDIERLGHKSKKEWLKELILKHKVNFLAIQETKLDHVNQMAVKYLWGNSNYSYVSSDSLGNSGGIICVWEKSMFRKENVTISDNFIAIYGTWIPYGLKVLFIVIYAPQQLSAKNLLWDYVSSLINNWSGEAIVMGDFNEVRCNEERYGSSFNTLGARRFNEFIMSAGLVDINLEGYKFTWSHPSASKMSKLDRFLVTEGLLVNFPSLAAECLDRHLSDHRPILLHEVVTDFGPTPFRLYHSWFSLTGFDDMVEKAWRSFSYTDSNAMVRFKKMLQELKSLIRAWVKERKADQSGSRNIIVKELGDIDKLLDDGLVDDELLLKRMDLTRQLHEMNNMASRDARQKSKIKWAIEGDENSRYFHGIINKKRSQLAIRGVFNNGIWYTEPAIVKDIFKNHFQTRFDQPQQPRFKINFQFDKCLSVDQVMDLDSMISREEIRRAVWSCGVDKSPGPDGFSFEFFRKYWSFIGTDFCGAVEHFFSKGNFSRGCNSSFIALIPKTSDAKYVSDYRPISLIGSVYKVVTKILATRLAPIIPDIISDTQSASLLRGIFWMVLSF